MRDRLRFPGRKIYIRVDQGAKDGHSYPPQPAQDKTSQRLSHSSDSSIPLFTLYLRISEEHDSRKYELLKGEIESILVFCGLFSATVAALIMPSITGAEGPPSDATVRQSGPDGFVMIIAANMLWFYSLILSISCAVHALMLQRLAKPSTWVTSLRYSEPEQARLSAYFAMGIERTNKAVRDLHYAIILSLFTFFSGLLVFFVGLNWFYLMVSIFLFFTYVPLYLFHRFRIFPRKSSPHCTPFTQEKIKGKGSLLDGEVLKRTLELSRSDDDLEQFFEAFPGFCASNVVENPLRSLDVLGVPRLAEALIGFWNRTVSSNRVSESVKVRRLVVCVKVIEAADLSIAVPHVLQLIFGGLSEVSRSAETGHSLQSMRNGNAASLARGIIAGVISNAERDDRWSMLVMDELGISRDVLRDYLAHGNSVLLANLIHVIRLFLDGLLQPHPDLTREAINILPSVSKFDILNALPELQHGFCALWNDIVRQVQSSSAENNPSIEILLDIWSLYVTLHGTTASDYDPLRPPASYPLCKGDCHRNLVTHVQWVGGNTSSDANFPIATNFPTTYPVSLRHHNTFPQSALHPELPA